VAASNTPSAPDVDGRINATPVATATRRPANGESPRSKLTSTSQNESESTSQLNAVKERERRVTSVAESREPVHTAPRGLREPLAREEAR
jgi:hypothetical protein